MNNAYYRLHDVLARRDFLEDYKKVIKLSNQVLKDDCKVLDETRRELKQGYGVDVEYKSTAKMEDTPVDKWVSHKDSFLYKGDIERKIFH